MYSMRYGTVPVVRATGGLADTVIEFNPNSGEGTGFRFDSYDADGFRSAVNRALALWPNRESWQQLVRNGMKQDFSWNRSARQYLDVYEQASSRRRIS